MSQSITEIFDGSNLISETLYESDGDGSSYSLPAAATLLLVEMSAGGGGGGGSIVSSTTGDNNWVAAGQGGQAGAACVLLISLDSVDRSPITLNVGHAGVGQTSIATPAMPVSDWEAAQYLIVQDGGDTNFGTFATCLGGKYGQPAAFTTTADYAGGSPSASIQTIYTTNGEGIGTNNINDSDLYRATGVVVNGFQDGHILINIRADLGYAAGGGGEEDVGANLTYAQKGRGHGVLSAWPGISTTGGGDGGKCSGGGGGSTCFGRGGIGGYGAGTSNDSCAGHAPFASGFSPGYGGGGGGGAANRISDGEYYYGNGGDGAGGFIKIKAYSNGGYQFQGIVS